MLGKQKLSLRTPASILGTAVSAQNYTTSNGVCDVISPPISYSIPNNIPNVCFINRDNLYCLNTKDSIFLHVSPKIYQCLINIPVSNRIMVKTLHFLSRLWMKAESCDNYLDEFQLHSRILRQNYGTRDLPLILAILEQNKWVKINHSYKASKASKGYSLLLKDFAPAVMVVNYPKLRQKLEATKEDAAQNNEVRTQKSFSGQQLEEYTSRKAYLIDVQSRLTLPSNLDFVFDSTLPEQHPRIVKDVARFMRGELLVSTDAAGRWYHFGTGCKKELRQAFLIDGKRTAEIDVKSSQPFLMASLYPEDCPEKASYLSIFEQGRFYETIAALAEIDISAKEAREKFKKRALREIFYDRCERPSYRLLRVFNGLFPTMGDILSALKTNEEHPAVTMQRQEALIIIGKVVDKLRMIQTPCLPVHDAIICLENDVILVKQLIVNAYCETIGVPPRIEVRGSY